MAGLEALLVLLCPCFLLGDKFLRNRSIEVVRGAVGEVRDPSIGLRTGVGVLSHLLVTQGFTVRMEAIRPIAEISLLSPRVAFPANRGQVTKLPRVPQQQVC